jgi:hypothetical protein
MRFFRLPRQPTAHGFCTHRPMQRRWRRTDRNMHNTHRYRLEILLIRVLLLIVCHTPEAVATETRPAQRTFTPPGAKNSRVEGSRVRSSRATPSRRTSKQARRSIRRSFSRMQRLSHPVASRARVLDPSRIQTIDGESFQYGAERFRVRGIDAMRMPDRLAAEERLDELLHQGPVTVVPAETDLLGRTVAEVLVNNHNISDLLSVR